MSLYSLFDIQSCSGCNSVQSRSIKMLSPASGTQRSSLIYPGNRNRSGRTATTSTVLQVGSSLIISLVGGHNFPGGVA